MKVAALAAGLSVAAVAAISASALVGSHPRVASASIEVPAAGNAGLAVRCPTGLRAASGGVAQLLPSGVEAVRAEPIGGRVWRVRFHNQGKGTRRVTASAVCLRGARVTVLHRAVPSGTLVRVRFRCQAGKTPGGFGWDGEPNRVGRGGWGLEQALAGKHAWTFRARQGRHSRLKELYATCLAHLGRTVIQRFSAPVATGQNVFLRQCSNGWAAIGGGFSLAGGGRFEGFSVTSKRSGRWLVHSRTGGRIVLSLVCAK